VQSIKYLDGHGVSETFTGEWQMHVW